MGSRLAAFQAEGRVPKMRPMAQATAEADELTCRTVDISSRRQTDGQEVDDPGGDDGAGENAQDDTADAAQRVTASVRELSR